jgi:hypothetical protein
MRAIVENGKFQKLIPGDTPREVELITKAWTAAEVVEHLWNDDSFASFAKLVQNQGVSRKEINDAVRKEFNAVRDAIREDNFRGNVKDVFRPAIEKKLEAASWKQMREMLADLSVGDRGNLAEHWYKVHYNPKAEHHVAVEVKRTDKKKGSTTPKEDRVIDLLRNEEAIEIKDVSGPIDQDQYFAYVQLMESGQVVEGSPVKKLKYVFLNEDGALANLLFFSKQLSKPAMRNKLEVEVFVKGEKKTVRTAAEATKLFKQLGGTL